MDDGRVVGLRAFRCVSAVPRDQWDGCSVRSCMIPAEEVPTLHPEAAATDAVVELSESTAAAELMPARRPWFLVGGSSVIRRNGVSRGSPRQVSEDSAQAQLRLRDRGMGRPQGRYGDGALWAPL